KRSDIWSFGVVLYEMLTGRQIFAGETVSDSLASVLKSEIDLGALPADTLRSVKRLLRRCLERDRRSRLRDIGDARLELEETPAADGLEAAPVPAPAPRQYLSWVLFAAAALGFLALSLVHFRETPPETPLRRFAITPPEFNRPLEHRPVISPDGKHIAYVAAAPGRAGAETRLWIQDLDQDAPRMVDGSDGAERPFWSPSSDSVGFIQEGNLRKVPLEGEPIITVCGLPGSFGSHIFFHGAWSSDGDSIVFSAGGSGLFAVSARGGTPSTLLEPSESDAPRGYSGLSFLP
ncbi:MAG: protein kinase, partial [bacterium]|nr:protein kinase [bacterium]